MNINDLTKDVEGKLIGCDDFYLIDDFNGRFTFLNNANCGDIVIRHWIDGDGIKIATEKGIACLITQNPKDNAIESAENLNFPLIITDYNKKVFSKFY